MKSSRGGNDDKLGSVLAGKYCLQCACNLGVVLYSPPFPVEYKAVALFLRIDVDGHGEAFFIYIYRPVSNACAVHLQFFRGNS